MLVLKISGGIIIVFSCMQFGLYKSSNAKVKRDVLQKINFALENLSNEIRLNRGELHRLYERLFCNEYIKFSDNRFHISEKYIKKSYIDKLNEMALSLGKSDSQGECKIIAIYKSIFEGFLKEADKEYKTNKKIWNTLGFGGGLTLVMLLV